MGEAQGVRGRFGLAFSSWKSYEVGAKLANKMKLGNMASLTYIQTQSNLLGVEQTNSIAHIAADITQPARLALLPLAGLYHLDHINSTIAPSPANLSSSGCLWGEEDPGER